MGATIKKSGGSSLRRYFDLIRMLQHQEPVPRQRVAQELGLSVRQVERMVAELSDMGLPVEVIHRQGYRMLPQPGLVPIHLSPQERWALLLLRKCSLTNLGSGAQEAIHTLTQRVKSYLSESVQDGLRQIETRVAAEPDSSPASAPVWETVVQALNRNLQLRFRYQPLTPSDLEERHVDPWGLFCVSSVWYLQGFDHDRQAPRNYRLSRILEVRLLNFAAEVPKRYQAADNLFHRWDIGDAPPLQVSFGCTDVLRKWIAENPIHPRQAVDSERVSLPVRNLDGFVNWLLGQEGVLWVQPDQVKQRVKQRLQERAEQLIGGC